jgi:hypothetical protein
MNIKEIKIITYLHIHNMPELKTRKQIAEYINDALYEDPEFFGQLREENIVDVREYNQ